VEWVPEGWRACLSGLLFSGTACGELLFVLLAALLAGIVPSLSWRALVFVMAVRPTPPRATPAEPNRPAPSPRSVAASPRRPSLQREPNRPAPSPRSVAASPRRPGLQRSLFPPPASLALSFALASLAHRSYPSCPRTRPGAPTSRRSGLGRGDGPPRQTRCSQRPPRLPGSPPPPPSLPRPRPARRRSRPRSARSSAFPRRGRWRCSGSRRPPTTTASAWPRPASAGAETCT
jgi:hypothetical protein